MFWYVFTAAVAASGGFLLCGVLAASKVGDLQDKVTDYARQLTAYDLLKARVRAIQQHGVKVHVSDPQSDYAYVVQKPNGKFGKFTLPGV